MMRRVARERHMQGRGSRVSKWSCSFSTNTNILILPICLLFIAISVETMSERFRMCLPTISVFEAENQKQ